MKDMVDYRALGKRIRNKRKMMQLSQDQLSKDVGISLSFLGHVERGSRKASVSTLLSICKALSVCPNDLLYDSIEWTNPSSKPAPRETESPFDMIRDLVRTLEIQYADDTFRSEKESKK